MGSKDPSNKRGTSGSWKGKRNNLSWSSGPSETMRDFITALTDAGCGVLFSRTVDGSALVVGVYSGDERSKEYITEPGDILACFKWLSETYC